MRFTAVGHLHGDQVRATWDDGVIAFTPPWVGQFLSEMLPPALGDVGLPTGPFFRAGDWLDPLATVYTLRDLMPDVVFSGEVPPVPDASDPDGTVY